MLDIFAGFAVGTIIAAAVSLATARPTLALLKRSVAIGPRL